MFHDIIDKIKRYHKFSPAEIRAILITCVLLAFMLTFREWGSGDTFETSTGLMNLGMVLIILIISMAFHLWIQMVSALWVGFRIEYKMWSTGLLIGLALTIISKGKLFFLAPGGIFIHHMAKHRLGYFRYGTNMWAQAMIVMWSVIGTVLLATVFKGLYTLFPGNVFFYKAMIVNLWLAIFCMLPFPPLDGSRILFNSRAFYAFLFAWVIAWALLLNYAPFWITIFGSILAAGIITLIYYIAYERLAWEFP